METKNKKNERTFVEGPSRFENGGYFMSLYRYGTRVPPAPMDQECEINFHVFRSRNWYFR